MSSALQNTAQRWNEKLLAPTSLKVFRTMLLLFVLCYTLWLTPVAHKLWGAGSLILPQANGWGVLNLLQYDPLRPHYRLFIGMQLLAILLRLLGRGEKLMDIAIFFFTANLYNAMYMASNGGHRLLLIFLFLLIFADEGIPASQNDRYAHVGRISTNAVLWLIRIQVAIVYLISGISKLYGPHWLNGSALNYVFSIDEFTLPLIQPLTHYPQLLIAATYAAIAYQLLFPVLVWFKKIKRPFLLVGIAMHLSIAFFMGLFDFGLIMIIAYLPFLSEHQINTALTKLRRFFV